MTTDDRIAVRRAELTKQRGERKDPDDLLLSPRERRGYESETAVIDAKITTFNAAVAAHAALPTLDADTKWRDHLVAWRKTLCDELMTIKSPVRDKDVMARADNITFSLRLIDFGFAVNRLPAPIMDLSSTRIGELMAAAGYDVVGFELLRGPNGFRGSLPDTEHRIKTLTRQRATAQAALESVLMDDTERAKVDAETAQDRDAFNAMHVKGSPDGLGWVAYTDDGDVLPVSEMTDIQKRAFERMDTAERAYRQSVIERQRVTT